MSHVWLVAKKKSGMIEKKGPQKVQTRKKKSVERSSRGVRVGIHYQENLTLPTGVPVLILTTSNMIRLDIQALIDALQRDPTHQGKENELTGEPFSRPLISLIQIDRDHKFGIQALPECVRSVRGTIAQVVGLLVKVETPSDDGVTSRVEIVDFFLSDAVGRREE